MKKIIALLLVLSLAFSMCALTACDNGGETKDSGTGDANTTANTPDDSKKPADDTTGAPADDKQENPADETTAGNAGNDEPGENQFPYEGDIIPPSCDPEGMDELGAPDADSVYLPVAPENVIHDGKGTWAANASDPRPNLPTKAFDLDITTFYDCDEGMSTQDAEEENVGIPYDGDEPFETGYVGAYFENGVYLRQIRFYCREGGTGEGRMKGGKFQVSTDGTEWIDICVLEDDFTPMTGFVEIVDVPEENQGTAYKYVRYVGPKEGYCNIAEIELWGKAA